MKNSQYPFRTEFFGKGKPVVTFVVGIHGDEHSPIKGVNLLKKYLARKTLRKAFTIIYANQEAIELKKRFIEQDLNDSFPGKRDGSYEQRLARLLIKEISKTDWCFDFHSTNFETDPYGIICKFNPKIAKVLQISDLNNYVFVDRQSLVKYAPFGIGFEIGYDKDPEGPKLMLKLILRLLYYFEVLPSEPLLKNRFNIFLVYNSISKKEFSKIAKLKDFQYQPAKKVLAWKNNRPFLNQEGFYPIWVNHPSYINLAKRIIIQDR